MEEETLKLIEWEKITLGPKITGINLIKLLGAYFGA
jgi:hypothetical protein